MSARGWEVSGPYVIVLTGLESDAMFIYMGPGMISS